MSFHRQILKYGSVGFDYTRERSCCSESVERACVLVLKQEMIRFSHDSYPIASVQSSGNSIYSIMGGLPFGNISLAEHNCIARKSCLGISPLKLLPVFTIKKRSRVKFLPLFKSRRNLPFLEFYPFLDMKLTINMALPFVVKMRDTRS